MIVLGIDREGIMLILVGLLIYLKLIHVCILEVDMSYVLLLPLHFETPLARLVIYFFMSYL